MNTSNCKFISGGVCAPLGFQAAGVASGVKKSGKLDLALLYSTTPAAAAGVFTKNQVKAAPLLLTKKHVASGYLQAVIINSGNANACTGQQGVVNAKQMVVGVANQLKLMPQLVGVASTGVIGVQLPIAKISQHIPPLATALACGQDEQAAQAIMTTDTFTKQVALQFTLGGKSITIGGMAKGSGMIHPNMATMLGFITSDVAISPPALSAALKLATGDSFNMISVDGDSSTNDMVLALANGQAGNPLIDSTEHPDWPVFYACLLQVASELAKLIAKDGEGATTMIEVQLTGAKSNKQAKAVAKGIVSSTLVKAAIFGKDANWGRIACAAGYSDSQVRADKMHIWLGDLMLFANGMPLPFDEDEAMHILNQPQVCIRVDLGLGDQSSTAWGCDLSYDYVKINSAYRT